MSGLALIIAFVAAVVLMVVAISSSRYTRFCQ